MDNREKTWRISTSSSEPSCGVISSGSPSAAHGGGGGGYGGGGGRSQGAGPSEASMPANKMPKWKRDHAAFQAAVSQGRRLKAAEEAGVDLATLPPPEPPEYDDRVPCPHCGRRFNAMAAERHIPKCTSIMAKPKTLARGGGATISRQMSGGQYVL